MRTLITILLTMNLLQVFAQSEDQRKKNFNLKNEIAIDGYDPVSYFSGKATEGRSTLKSPYKGIIYLFATKENIELFKANPTKYEPAYGGWCAFAMGETGEKVKVDPETYKIIDGKLYLFYNFWGNNTLDDWNEKEKILKASGDINWKKFIP
jgi:YHS domain-containing protein